MSSGFKRWDDDRAMLVEDGWNTVPKKVIGL